MPWKGFLMKSVCPNCKKQLEHEDHLFEIQCQCGHRFNPFVNFSTQTESESQFSESAAAFSDIRNFGETLVENASEVPLSQIAEQTRSKKVTVPLFNADFIFYAQAPNQNLESMSPISLTVDINMEDPDPLDRGWTALKEKAMSLGANGIIPFPFHLLSSKKALFSGIPVKINPISQ
jgi:hypothetical protein